MSERPVALVTGGSRGIGAAICRHAAAAGYAVVVNYATSASAAGELAAGIGNGSVALAADIGAEDETVAMFAEVDRRFGRLDLVVNNAGIAGSYGSIDVVDAPMLQRLFAVNITGAFICSREAATRMRTDRGGHGGSIVNISSRSAQLGAGGEWIHYAATKGAIDSLTVGLAKELATVGVRVNAVRPGFVDTEFHAQGDASRLARLTPTVPMGRAGTPDEVAEAVMWLSSPKASYVTGAFLDVSGGR